MSVSSPSKQNSCQLPTKKSALKETVDLLRIQAKMQRMKVSMSAEELMNYCLENAQDDCLLQGIPAGGNPYKEGKNCPVMQQIPQMLSSWTYFALSVLMGKSSNVGCSTIFPVFHVSRVNKIDREIKLLIVLP